MKYISFNMIRRKRTWCYILVVLYPFICFYLWSSDKKAIRTIHEKQILSPKSRTTTPSQILRKKAYFQVNNDIEGPGKSSLSIRWTLFFLGGWVLGLLLGWGSCTCISKFVLNNFYSPIHVWFIFKKQYDKLNIFTFAKSIIHH